MSGALEIFKATARLVLDKGDFDKGVSDAEKSGKSLADNLSGYMEKAKKIITGVLTVAAVKKVASSIWDLAKSTADFGDKIAKQSQALGFSIKGYQEWEYILGQSGASIDNLGMTIKTLNEAIAGNSAETAAGLSKLGLSAAQLSKMSSEEQFNAIVNAFQKMPAGVDKSRLAMQLLGRNAQQLMPLLNSAPGTVDDLRQRFHDLGLEMSEEEAHAAEGFGDALDDLSRTWDAIKRKFGSRLLPGFTSSMVTMANSLGRVSNSITDAFKSGDWSGVFSTITNELKSLVPKAVSKATSIVKGLFENADEAVGLAVSILGGIANGIADALPVLIAKLPGIVDTIWNGLKGPVTNLGNSIIDAINKIFGTNVPHLEAIVTWVQEKWDDVKKAFKDARNWVKEKRDAIVTWVNDKWTAVKDAFDNARTWAKEKREAAVEWVNNKLDDIKLAFENAKTWAAEKRTAAVDWLNSKWDDVKKAFEDAKTWAAEKRDAAINWVMNAWQDVKDAFATVGAWVSNTAHDVKLSITATVSEWIEAIKKWLDGTGITDIVLNITSKVSDWIKWIKEWMDGVGLTDIALNFISTISEWIKKIGNWLSGEGISDIGIHFLGTVSEWIKTIQDWITNGINIAVNFFKGAVEGLTNDTGTFQGGEPSGLGWGESLEVPAPSGWGFAKGLNYVPFDGYAYLHRGETILNQSQGRDWRQGGSGGFNPQALYSMVAEAVASAVANIQINMDGKAVGNAVTQQVSRNIYQQQFGRRFATV